MSSRHSVVAERILKAPYWSTMEPLICLSISSLVKKILMKLNLGTIGIDSTAGVPVKVYSPAEYSVSGRANVSTRYFALLVCLLGILM